MSGIESVPKELRGKQTAGEITYEPIRDLSSLEREYLEEYFSSIREREEWSVKVAKYVVPSLTLIGYGIGVIEEGWLNMGIFLLVFGNLFIYMYCMKRKRQIEELSTKNPVVEIEGDLSYRSVSFSIVGSGLHVGEFQVGFPPGWGKKINFFQFTGKEVTLEVYITSNQNIIVAIEGEGHDGEQKRLTLEDALEEGIIDMEDARV